MEFYLKRHLLILKNIQRKVDHKQRRSSRDELRVEQWSENDTDVPSVYSIGRLNSDDSCDAKNPFETMRNFGSSSTVESYSPLPERVSERERMPEWKPDHIELTDIVQSKEASRKGYSTKVTCVSLSSLFQAVEQ